ncbi:MAG: FtsW/RodA/SpoVE family cell cycle protein [Bacteroidaceae bacterium]|nr:FtsW/RodA/SpoVE family cell cycle protein [Bacteroidaceae bacterium]
MALNKASFEEKGLMQGDTVVWMIFLLLCMVSVIEVYSASSNMSYDSGHYWDPVMRHGSFVLVGIILAWLIHLIPCVWFKLLSVVMLLVSLVMLVFVLFAGKINGGARWLDVGIFSFQPSELAKISLVGVAAFLLSSMRTEKGASNLSFKIVIGLTLLVLGLIATENLSTAGIIFLVILGILFISQAPSKWLAWIVGGMITAAALGFFVAHKIEESTLEVWSAQENGILHRVPTWVHRITDHHVTPENPDDYDIYDNVQVTHAKIAIATCNLVGKGPGNSVERDYLPQAFSDFIYAIIIEEGGILSGAFVMFLYLLLMWRAMKIAKRCKALFPAYLVMGLALMMVVQAMINMAVAVGAFPVTGQPLPLISKGGTATFVNCAYIGMILSVSRSAKKVDEASNEQKKITTKAV